MFQMVLWNVGDFFLKCIFFNLFAKVYRKLKKIDCKVELIQCYLFDQFFNIINRVVFIAVFGIALQMCGVLGAFHSSIKI